jgi:two-component system phosphate regulon sensor histidine kinase PhoR
MAQTLLGAGLEGRNFASFLRQPTVLDAIETCLQTENAQEAIYLGSNSGNDTTFNVYCKFVPKIGWQNDGAVLISFEDTTRLQAAEQMRRDFVANVSHELRTPLTALLGFIETLRGPAKDDAEARERFLGIMEQEAGRMNRLVGDLLSLSRVEASERVRPSEVIQLNELLASTVLSIGHIADTAKIDIVTDFADPPVTVVGDMDQLRQVITNLLENAIKYGGTGGKVVVSLAFVDPDPAVRGPSAHIAVRDNGPGIDPLHLPRLTERFYRADSHRSRELGGTGLGLAIAKHIVNRHRGRLRMESELGQGAVFTVILPAQKR